MSTLEILRAARERLSNLRSPAVVLADYDAAIRAEEARVTA